MINFAWYLAWVLLPLIPALLLFLVLPQSKSSVKGIFNGKEIKLSGSVAVFFLLFYAMNPVKLNLIDTGAFQDGWEMEASFVDMNNNPIPASQLLRIEAIPNTRYELLDDKKINVYLPVLQVRHDETLTIPYKLRFIFNDFEAQTVSASEYFNNKEYCRVDKKNQVLCLKNLPRLVAKKKEIQDSSLFEPAREIVIN